MSSTTTPKKPTTPGSVSSGAAARRQPPSAATSSPTPAARGASPSNINSNVLSTNGVARNSSLKNTPGTGRPPRAGAARRPGSTASANPTSAEDVAKAEEAKAETAALIDSLKQSLRDTEMASDDYGRQLAAAQQKVDDLMAEHAKLEEQYHESTEKIEELEFDKRESKRHAQEMERIYESERVAMMKDREDAASRESEMKGSIQRLKESAVGREVRGGMGADNRSPRQGRSPTRGSPKIGEEGSSFAPSSLPRSDSQGTSRLVIQKDQIIEGLRLELAEAQIKLVEMENAGGDRLQELEKSLLETRMANARLMEDNDSFQLLLGERTISGDFQKTELMQQQDTTSGSGGLGSLAEELESAEGEGTTSRRLEVELRSAKDQNKALTLYIEKIISRVLQHENFETILDQKGGLGAPPVRPSSSRDKDLPPPPPPKDDGTQGESLLQRATSVVRRQRPVSAMFAPHAGDEAAGAQPANITRRPRPQSVYANAPADRAPTANEDPATAPSIPLGRTASVSVRRPNANPSAPPSSHHRRTGSDRSNDLPGAAGIVNQMYRGPSGGAAPMSPLSPGSASRSYFSPAKPPRSAGADGGAGGSPPGQRPASGSSAAGHRARDSSESAASRLSGDSGGAAAASSEVSSPPRDRAGNTQYTGAVMQQNKLRPLRLVQESGGEDAAAAEAAAARKRANRASWMGWFNRPKEEGGAVPGLETTDEQPER